MKKLKFNGDYCGDILVIGFTGSSTKITQYLKKEFRIGHRFGHPVEQKFNIKKGNIGEAIVMHVEVFPWATRRDILLKLEKERVVKRLVG